MKTTMKEQVKALWRLCFHDSEEFIDMYFRLCYRDDRNLVIESDGKAIAALQMLPYPMTFGGSTVPIAYISGACTHPDFRNGGAMRRLLSQAFEQMYGRDVLFSTLIPAEPWLFDYYARMGYAPLFCYSAEEIETQVAEETGMRCFDLARHDVARDAEIMNEVFVYFNRKLAERPCCVQHTTDDFRAVVEDLRISNGFMVVAQQEARIVGLAIGYNSEGECVDGNGRQCAIHELIAESYEAERCLLRHVGLLTGCRRITRRLPPDGKSPQHPLGMIRIIHLWKLLQLHVKTYPEDNVILHITDEQLPANSGYYRLDNGQCTYSATPLKGNTLQFTIESFTRLVFHNESPYMSLMLN